MDEALISAALPTAKPRANVTRSFNAEAGKGMRMAHAKAIVLGNTGFELLSAEAHVSGTEGCQRRHAESRVRQESLQRGERKQEQLARAKGPGRPVTRPIQIDPNIE
jgi:hypothetical protein